MTKSRLFTALAVAVASAGIGCSSDKPHGYGQQRPPVDQLDSRDRGLQSKDVVNASDQMAMDLLQLATRFWLAFPAQRGVSPRHTPSY